MFDPMGPLVSKTFIERSQQDHLEEHSEFIWVDSDRKMRYVMVERHWENLPHLLCRARTKRAAKSDNLEPFAIWRYKQTPSGPRWVWRKLTACRVPAEMVLGLCGADFKVRGIIGEAKSLICWDDGVDGMEFFMSLDSLIPLAVVNGNHARVVLSVPQQVEWVKSLPPYELTEEELFSLDKLTHKTAGEGLVLPGRLSFRRWDIFATSGRPVQLWLVAFLGDPDDARRPQSKGYDVLGRTHHIPGYRPLTWCRFVPCQADPNFIYLKVVGKPGFQAVPMERHEEEREEKQDRPLQGEISTNLLQ